MQNPPKAQAERRVQPFCHGMESALISLFEVISMPEAIKIPTIAWGIAALVFFPFFLPNPYNTGLFAIRLLLAALFAYCAYGTYKKGLTPDASLEQRTLARRSAFGQVAAAAAVVLIGLVVGVGLGIAGLPSYPSVGAFAASIDGKYVAQDGVGSSVEFLSDGTVIFGSGGDQGVWKWTKLDDGRLKLEPGPGMFGAETTVCAYSAAANELRLTNCGLAMTLNRRQF
ncbi:hypothetical protein NKJ06_22730 [Mesorhizobium sp. M0293]|uniref:hypothetical protein n=1 Tax=Mesorhizobium sp. M0293 TaxID=2956930 RepID=UPI0033395882